MYCCGNLDFYVNLLRNFVIVPSKGIVLLEKKEDSNGLQFAASLVCGSSSDAGHVLGQESGLR